MVSRQWSMFGISWFLRNCILNGYKKCHLDTGIIIRHSVIYSSFHCWAAYSNRDGHPLTWMYFGKHWFFRTEFKWEVLNRFLLTILVYMNTSLLEVAFRRLPESKNDYLWSLMLILYELCFHTQGGLNLVNVRNLH